MPVWSAGCARIRSVRHNLTPWIEVVRMLRRRRGPTTYGGGALGGAFQSNTLNRFLEDKNRTIRAFPACVERFVLLVRPVASRPCSWSGGST